MVTRSFEVTGRGNDLPFYVKISDCTEPDVSLVTAEAQAHMLPLFFQKDEVRTELLLIALQDSRAAIQ